MSRERRVTEEEEKDNYPVVMGRFDNSYVNAEIEIIQNDQLSIIEAIAIKTKQEEEYESKKQRENCAAIDGGHCNRNAEIIEDTNSEVIRVNTEDVIVVHPSSPVHSEQV